MVGHYAILFERLNMKKTFHILYHLQYGSMWYHRHIDQVVKHNDETKTKTDLFDIGGIFISRTNLYSLSSQLFPSYPFTHVQLNANNWSLHVPLCRQGFGEHSSISRKIKQTLVVKLFGTYLVWWGVFMMCVGWVGEECGGCKLSFNLNAISALGMVSPGLCKC